MILTMAMLHPTAILLTASGYLCQERKLQGNYVSNVLSRPTQFSGKEQLPEPKMLLLRYSYPWLHLRVYQTKLFLEVHI